MKAHVLPVRVLVAAGLSTLLGAPSLAGCDNHDLVPFIGTDVPTGPILGDMPPVAPDGQGIIRVRDVPMSNCRLTFHVSELGVKEFAVDVDFSWNANIDTLAGPGFWICWGECRGYITDEAGNKECVLRAYYHSRRRQVSDGLWITDAEWLGTFCSGPLEGIGMKAREICESWHPGLVTGYSGKLTGVLIVPDSFDRPRPHHPNRKDRR